MYTQNSDIVLGPVADALRYSNTARTTGENSPWTALCLASHPTVAQPRKVPINVHNFCLY